MTTTTKRVPSGAAVSTTARVTGAITPGTTKRVTAAITANTTDRLPTDVIGLGPFLLLTGDFEGALRLTGSSGDSVEYEGYLKLTGTY